MSDDKLSPAAMIAITVMRVLVGWHFLYEGVSKLSSPSWSAVGYMRVARGPFAACSTGLRVSPICSTTPT